VFSVSKDWSLRGWNSENVVEAAVIVLYRYNAVIQRPHNPTRSQQLQPHSHCFAHSMINLCWLKTHFQSRLQRHATVCRKYPFGLTTFRQQIRHSWTNWVLATINLQLDFCITDVTPRSSATAKSTVRPSCLVGVLHDISREKICWRLINYVIGHESEFGEITQNNGNYAVQGHSRSPILVPIESPYTTSY